MPSTMKKTEFNRILSHLPKTLISLWKEPWTLREACALWVSVSSPVKHKGRICRQAPSRTDTRSVLVSGSQGFLLWFLLSFPRRGLQFEGLFRCADVPWGSAGLFSWLAPSLGEYLFSAPSVWGLAECQVPGLSAAPLCGPGAGGLHEELWEEIS